MKYKIVGFFVALMIITVFVAKPIMHLSTQETLVLKVEERERIVERDVDGKVTSKYLVFTDKGVFEVTDTILFFDFSSSDRYNSLKVGEEFEVKTTGIRFPFLSMYPNIIEVKSVGR